MLLLVTWEVLDVTSYCVEAGPVPGAAHCPAPVIGASDQGGSVVGAVRPQGPHLALLPQQQHLQCNIGYDLSYYEKNKMTRSIFKI